MSSVADSPSPVSSFTPTARAALLLAAREQLRELQLPHPSARQIFDATGAGRSRAYEASQTVLGSLSNLFRGPGRPAKASPTPTPDVSAELSRAVLAFVLEHPGCVSAGPKRRQYSPSFVRFVLELRHEHAALDLDVFARAVSVPVGTLKGWLNPNQQAPQQSTTVEDAASDQRIESDATLGDAATTLPVTNDVTGDGGASDAANIDAPATAPSSYGSSSVVSLYIETIVTEWRVWEGSFIDFCDHLDKHHRIPFGRSFISNVLEELGERTPKRRSGRSPDERALRGAFETFFPGAQWVGDGTPIEIHFGEQSYTFNLELMVDADSDAFIGISVRDEEDSQAVTEAFHDGVATTGEPPLATLLDNRPSNHSAEVDDALGDTVRIRATKGRPQNKAHCEGAFGLFEQILPALVVSSTLPHEQARQVVTLVFQTLLRALNGRPRADRNGQSRAELYRGRKPTAEQIAEARASLEERARKQDLARETLRARQDPRKHELLDEAFERFGLADPEHHVRTSIASYPFSAIVDAVAVFEAKASVGSLPDDNRERYLLGIVRNCAAQAEGNALTESLIRRRRAAHDAMLASLEADRDLIERLVPDPDQRLERFIDAATESDRRFDRLFWLDAAAHVIGHGSRSRQDDRLRDASRRIHAAFDVSPRDRQDMTRHLASLVIPVI